MEQKERLPLLADNGRRLIRKLADLRPVWLTAAALGESIGVSRRTVMRELPGMEKWLLAAGFRLVRSPGQGVRLEEDETRRAALRGFHAEIYETCAADFGSERSAMLRMKELWNYLRFTFTDCEREMKRVLKSKSPSEFLSAADTVLLSCPLAPEPAYRPKEAAV